MTPIKFEGMTVLMGAGQPEYNPLPAHLDKGDKEGRLTCCWALTWRERLKLLWTGKLWQQVLTFQTPLQPQLLLTTRPELLDPRRLTTPDGTA